LGWCVLWFHVFWTSCLLILIWKSLKINVNIRPQQMWKKKSLFLFFHFNKTPTPFSFAAITSVVFLIWSNNPCSSLWGIDSSPNNRHLWNSGFQDIQSCCISAIDYNDVIVIGSLFSHGPKPFAGSLVSKVNHEYHFQ